MNKVWLNSYPSTVPADIDCHRYRSVVHILEGAFKRYARRAAFISMGTTLTYHDVDIASQKVAAWLQAKGVQPGTRVAIMMPNVLHYPILIAGILRAGCVVVNINPLYTPRELEHQLKDSGAEVIFIFENFAHTLAGIVHETAVKHIVTAAMGDMQGWLKGRIINAVIRHIKKLVPDYVLPAATMFNELLETAETLPYTPVQAQAEDIAFLQYTGGTTGVAKGAMLTHRNIIANILQTEAWLSPALLKKPDIIQPYVVCALPLYHIFSLMVCGLVGPRIGATNILIANPRDLGGLLREIAPYPIHVFPAVNTLYNGLLNHPRFRKFDASHLRICIGGGAAIQQAVAQRWKDRTGCPILEGYGLSETSPVATANPAIATEYTGSIGLPLPSTEIAILNDAGQPVPLGESGEIAIRGPQVMAGYWQRPEDTAAVMTADGFFKSGDIGIMDDKGYTRIVDRKKDMILVSGFNVYPNEIEQVVMTHPGVLECACVGVPDETTGEAVKLFVVPRDKTLTATALTDFCRQQLTGYKKPKYIEFRTALPKSNVGKILRRELRDGTQ